MINNTKNLHSEKIKSLADKYVIEGFDVLIKPKTDELPFDLDNYQPDIIATKNNSGLVIEIRTSLSRISVERLQALAEQVSTHPGWRFLLVTLEDIEAKSLPGTSEQLPSWQELTNRFFQAHKLIENDEIEPAFLFLWSIFEGALRKRVIDLSIPIERFPVIGLLRHLYSLGELSISQFDLAQACFEVHNRLAHGYIENLNLPVVHNFDNLVRELLEKWKVELAISQLSPEDLAAFRIWFGKFDAASLDKQQALMTDLYNKKSLLFALELNGDLINEKLKKELNLNDEQVINVELDVSNLLPENLAAFRTWFAEFDAVAWDKQIQEDVASGRLDVLAEKALKHLREGRCNDL